MKQRVIVIFFCLVCCNVFSQRNPFDVARNGTLDELKNLMVKDYKVVNSINEDGNSMLILACYNGNTEVALHLIKNVEDINYSSKMGSALMAAVVKNKFELVKLLL